MTNNPLWDCANEVERLRDELERVQSNHVTVAEEIQRRHDACAPLTAEIERLRAALQVIATCGGSDSDQDYARLVLDRAKPE